MHFILLLLIVTIIIIILRKIWNKDVKSSWKIPDSDISKHWKNILIENVPYYNSLNEKEKSRFEYKVQEFILNYKITAVKTEIDDTDRILVAASAIIPIFGFDHWRYHQLSEVLIYPNSFNRDYELEGEDRRILGMVGSGSMDGIMILSQQALRLGFKNETDKKNTAIHEFVHLIDKEGGTIDGIPSVLMQKQYAIPWLKFIDEQIDILRNEASDINPYGATNRAEFFSVASEYFFERPKLLKRKHPELYQHLEKLFNQDMSSRKLTKK